MQVAIAGAGGISPTVSLLATGSTRAQEHATHALASLGFDNIDNQRQVRGLPKADERHVAIAESSPLLLGPLECLRL